VNPDTSHHVLESRIFGSTGLALSEPGGGRANHGLYGLDYSHPKLELGKK
jgi:hypothetical protein